MNPGSRDRTSEAAMEASLVGTARVARLTMRGRRSRLTRSVAVGYVSEPDGSILVAAGDDAAWAGNLLADPRVTVDVGERHFEAAAEPLEPADHARAIGGLILRYGTPAERLGRGPSFRLRPINGRGDAGDGDPEGRS